MKIIILAFLFVPFYSHGISFEASYGLGAENSLGPTAKIKTLNLGVHNVLPKNLCYKFSTGAYWDVSRDLVSLLTFIQAGPRIEPLPFLYFENLIGPGFISKKDDLLGSHFQFAIDLGFGFQTPGTKVAIGLNFRHISNAGIKKPNHGRNFWTLNLSVPL